MNDLQEETIYFYSVDGPYGFLSNFYPFVSSDGRLTSSEHLYQADKFEDPELRALILQQSTAKLCYKLAWRHSDRVRKNWQQPVPSQQQSDLASYVGVALLEKDLAMWRALQIKFDNPQLRAKLSATGHKRLVEHAMKDAHFGCGLDGRGLNMLGKQLEFLRSQPRSRL
jgi:GTP cyclohydrolase II